MSPSTHSDIQTRANLFPLPNLILNPGGKITLNIFEPRYLELLDDCLVNNTPMAIGHALPSEEERFISIPHEKFPYVFQEVGFGKVTLLAETDAKTKIIIVEGQGKGTISRVIPSNSPYLTVDIDPLPFQNELDGMNTFLYRRLKELTREKVQPLVQNQREVSVIMENLKDPCELVAFYTDHLLKDFDTRLQIFKANDVNEKIEILSNYLVKVH